MKRLLLAFMALSALPLAAQSLEDLNVQIHGYATQGFVYTTQNNWNSMASSDGSPAWTEAVFNLTAQPNPKLRVGAQVRYFLMGNFGNEITLDWASGDYKLNEKLGVRFGKVKTANGLLNDIQDIDPAFLWSILPQGGYPITSRTSILAHYGGAVYGNLHLGPKVGKLEYQFYGGERVLPENDGFFVTIQETGAYFPNGLSGPTAGGTVRWHAPIEGLVLGAAIDRENLVGALTVPAAGLSGNNIDAPFKIPYFFGKYEQKKVMFAAEYSRVAADHKSVFTVGPSGVQHSYIDHRTWYVMSSYKVMEKLNAGIYYSSYFDRKIALGPLRYQKDWALSGRYDFNPFMYLKVEQHFVDGTLVGYLKVNNSHTKPDTRMTILKLGVSF